MPPLQRSLLGMAVRVREVVSLSDAALLRIKEIYTDSFPPEERLGDWFFTQGIESRAREPRSGWPVYHLLVAEDEGRVAGFAAANYFANEGDGSPINLGFLVYLAVEAGGRSRGTGALLYTATRAQLALDARFLAWELTGMAFTVERPDAATNEEERSQRERRIAFYLRQGANLLASVEYENPPLHEGDDPIPLHLMYHPAGRPTWPPEDLHRALHRLIAGLQSDGAE